MKTLSKTWMARAAALAFAASAITLATNGCLSVDADAQKAPLVNYVSDWRDEVIYQVLVDRFANGDKSNDFNVRPGALARYQGGDWRGLEEHIDYLEALGVTTVWISPIVRNVETDADIDECVAFTTELSRIIPVALGIAPFCSKRNTPLDRMPYAGIEVVNDRLDRLRRGLKGRADVRSTSAKWAWVEYVLAQGGEAEGLAVIDAVHGGGGFAAYKKAFAPFSDEKRKGRRHLTLA